MAAEKCATDANLKQAVTALLFYTDFFYAGVLTFLPRWNKFLKGKCDYIEVWCAPSAVCVSRVDGRQSKVAGTRVLFVLFF